MAKGWRKSHKEHVCPICQQEFIPTSSQLSNLKSGKRKQLFCSRACSLKQHIKTGRRQVVNGYIRITPEGGESTYEHIVVMEQKLGRKLRVGEEVHHIDENKTNNDPSNLEVKLKPIHTGEHQIEHGEKHIFRKYSFEDIEKAREMYKNGHTIAEIARHFGMDYSHCFHTIKGRRATAK